MTMVSDKQFTTTYFIKYFADFTQSTAMGAPTYEIDPSFPHSIPTTSFITPICVFINF